MGRYGAVLLAVCVSHGASDAWARPIEFAFQQPSGFSSVDDYETFYEIEGYHFLLSPSPDLSEATVVDSADLPPDALDELGLPRVGADGVIRVSIEGGDGDVYKAIRAYSADIVSPPSNVVLDEDGDLAGPAAPPPDPEPEPEPPAEEPDGGTDGVVDDFETLSRMALDFERAFRTHVAGARTREEYLSGYATIFESEFLPRLAAVEDVSRDRSQLTRSDRRMLTRYDRRIRKLGTILRVGPDRDLDPATKERLLRTVSHRVTELVTRIDRRIARIERRLDKSR